MTRHAHEDKDNVIAMDRHPKLIGQSMLSQVEGYWSALRQGAQVPSRHQIDPRGIEAALPYAFVLERISPAQARIRVSGTHLSDLMGMELRGMPFSALFEPDARSAASDLLSAVFDQVAVLRAQLRSPTGFGRPALDGRLLLLPLRDDRGEISRALGCLTTSGTMGRTPRRLMVTDQSLQRVDHMPVPDKPLAPLPGGFAEGARAFVPFRTVDAAPQEAVANPAAKPSLKVVK